MRGTSLIEPGPVDQPRAPSFATTLRAARLGRSHDLNGPKAGGQSESEGLAGDLFIDLLKRESLRDEHRIGYVNPLHSFLPSWLRGPKLFLPGIGPRRVDFEW
jgi:hypothetical protein